MRELDLVGTPVAIIDQSFGELGSAAAVQALHAGAEVEIAVSTPGDDFASPFAQFSGLEAYRFRLGAPVGQQ